MIDQRPRPSAPAIQAIAERLPLRDQCADAAMALLTAHHWSDVEAGIAEMRRIARRRVVIFTWDPQLFAQFWLPSEYLPEAAEVDAAQAVPIQTLTDLLGNAEVRPVPVPHDCTDGFGAAYWRRPHAYLDPTVRAGISMLAKPAPTNSALGYTDWPTICEPGNGNTTMRICFTSTTSTSGTALLIADQ